MDEALGFAWGNRLLTGFRILRSMGDTACRRGENDSVENRRVFLI